MAQFVYIQDASRRQPPTPLSDTGLAPGCGVMIHAEFVNAIDLWNTSTFCDFLITFFLKSLLSVTFLVKSVTFLLKSLLSHQFSIEISTADHFSSSFLSN